MLSLLSCLLAVCVLMEARNWEINSVGGEWLSITLFGSLTSTAVPNHQASSQKHKTRSRLFRKKIYFPVQYVFFLSLFKWIPFS